MRYKKVLINFSFRFTLMSFLILFVIGCGTSSLTDHVRINKQYPIREPNQISPPIVDGPIHECARSVHVRGFAPSALVIVYANGADQVGQAVPHFGFSDINLTRALEIGEQITATQTVGSIESLHTVEPVNVEPWPEGLSKLPQPDVGDNLYECGRIVPVGNLYPSCRVKIYEDGVDRGQAESPGTWKAVWANSDLSADKPVTAQQFACEGDENPLESNVSEEVTVTPMPADFHPPGLVETTLVVGNDSVTLDNLYVGAKVSVFDHDVDVGGGYATGNSNWVPLNTPLTLASSVTADQTLCSTSDRSKPTPVNPKLPVPTLVVPICDDDHFVRIDNTVINATVVVLRNGDPIALGGAAEGELTLALGDSLSSGDTLSVVQYMGENTSDPSPGEVVCCCTERCWNLEITDEDWNNYGPVPSGPSSALVFEGVAANDIFEFELTADFDIINNPDLPKGEAKSDGSLSYVDPDTNADVIIPITLEGRGKSRFNNCSFRPLKIVFADKQVGNIFDGASKKVKVVTHCGPATWDILDGSPDEQRRYLLAEYYFYRVLQTLGSTSLKTRLALITYRNPDETEILTEYAFLREREDDACERCGFEDEASDGDVLAPDASSVFQAHMYNKFAYNNDYHPESGHNTILCKDAAGNGFYMPYDWDLTGVIHPEYFKNNDVTYEENATVFSSWLSNAMPQVRTKVQAYAIVQHEAEMRAVIENALIDAKGKTLLKGWFEQYIRILKCFIATP